MTDCSGAFNKYAGNKLVADSFAIIMGSSHCEPLLFNNASEWDKKTMGEWNYNTNQAGIHKILDKRVAENAPFENIYTLAMRGIHDAGLAGNLTQEEQVDLVNRAITDQRRIIAAHVSQPVEEVPQVMGGWVNSLAIPVSKPLRACGSNFIISLLSANPNIWVGDMNGTPTVCRTNA